MKKTLKNVTFSISVESIDKLRMAVGKGYAESLNSAIREAIELYTAHISKEELKKEMEDASKDPLFMKDVKNSMESFKTSDNETSELISDW